MLLLLPLAALAQSRVEYAIAFPNAVHHEATISVTYRELGDAPLQLRMSRSSPGRYAIHEFAKNVYQLQFVDGAGDALTATRPNPYQWDVAGHNGTVTVTYILYADRAGGTYSGIDLTHAHLNMPATFMWARGYDDRPISVTFQPADDRWKIATQLQPTDEEFVFTAPNLQYFMDSPVELSAFSERSWPIESNGRSYQIRLVVHHDGTEEDIDEYVEKAKKVVDEQIKVFGEPPDFDYGTYTFIADYLPYVVGDGMEHRNSTILTSSQSLIETDATDQLSTLSHEFFHSWNGERIRPMQLEPFNFERANMSANLWFFEGFTSYYDDLLLLRAGVIDVTQYLQRLAKAVNAVQDTPGRQVQSVAQASYDAWVKYYRGDENTANATVSYYTKGALVALALDLTLRKEGRGTLDAVMQRLWRVSGGGPIGETDIAAALREVGGRGYGRELAAWVHGTGELPAGAEAASVLVQALDDRSAVAG